MAFSERDKEPHAGTAYFETLNDVIAILREKPRILAQIVRVTITEQYSEISLSSELDGPGDFVVLLQTGPGCDPRFLPADPRSVYVRDVRDARSFCSEADALSAVKYGFHSTAPVAIRRVVKSEPKVTYEWEILK